MCQEYGFYPGFRFILKSKFIKSPEKTIMTWFIFTIFVVTYMLRIFEVYYSIYPATDNSKSKETQVFNIVYLVIITITTVGYGDLAPKSNPGKFITMWLAIWGTMMMAFVVAALTKVLSMNDK